MLTAWLGDINPNERRDCLESQGIANFYTPENAVEAFSFLCAYRRNQAQLMEAPTARAPDEPRPDLEEASALRSRRAGAGQEAPEPSTKRGRCSRRFGLPVPGIDGRGDRGRRGGRRRARSAFRWW